VDIRRIRLDCQGILTQDPKGQVSRIPLTLEQCNIISKDPMLKSYEIRKLLERNLPGWNLNTGDLQMEVHLESSPFLSHPVRIYYEIEESCPLECSFCVPRSSGVREHVDECFLLEAICQSGAFQVQLTGGEVFLRGYRLIPLLEKISDMGLAVILSTSGIWRNIPDKKGFAQELSRQSHIVQIKLSIEGPAEIHDSLRGKGNYAETLDTLKILSETGFKLRINQTLFRRNCSQDCLEHMVALAERYNASLQLVPLRPIGSVANNYCNEQPTSNQLLSLHRKVSEIRNQKNLRIKINFDYHDPNRNVPDDLLDYREIYDAKAGPRCSAAVLGVHMDASGNIYPCGFVATEPKFLAGRVSETTNLLDIWRESEVLRQIRKIETPKDCRDCLHFTQGCAGGCWVMRWAKAGSLTALDPYCTREH